MRRLFKIAGWIGLGLSSLLLVATVVLGVRSVGHREEWIFNYVEPNPEWKTGPLSGRGTQRFRIVCVTQGRLSLQWGTWVPELTKVPEHSHERRKTAGTDDAKREFESSFQPGERRQWGDFERVWRFAGAGFLYGRAPVRPETGQSRYERFWLALPFWMPATLSGLWPALLITRRLVKKKSHATGLCPHCGYDLRATPDRCPECGAVPPYEARARETN